MVKLLNDETFLLNASDEESCAEVLWAAAWICGEYCGELAEPHKLLDYLLQPSVSKLHPETIAVYIQASTKVFGFWSSELAQKWDDDYLPRINETVDFLVGRLSVLSANPDIEVERVANAFGLFTFVRTDLSGYRPRPQESYAFAEASTSSFDPISSSEPQFPKSMYLSGRSYARGDDRRGGRAAMDDRPVPYKIYTGRVSGLKEFGAFVTLEGVSGRTEGMVDRDCVINNLKLPSTRVGVD